MNFDLIQQIIVVIFAISIIGLPCYFYYKNKENRMKFELRKAKIIQKLGLNREQLEKRRKGLDGYDFLKYNLSEALITQSNIDIRV
mgnify:CR=1 FL=1